MEMSVRSRQKFADLAAGCGTMRTIEQVYEAYGFHVPAGFEPAPGGMRRSLCDAVEAGQDLANDAVCRRLLHVYLDAIDDWGRRDASFSPLKEGEDPLLPDARSLLRSLQRDGAPVDDDASLVLGAAAPVLAIERFDRLGQPRVLLEHLGRTEAGTASDPAAAIGSAKELTESVFKFVLDDYGVTYERGAGLSELYRLVAGELGLSRTAVPSSVKGSQASHKVLQNFSTAVQCLAELRNEIGLGHGGTVPSPALGRHARLAANAARTIAEFVLETWHERQQTAA